MLIHTAAALAAAVLFSHGPPPEEPTLQVGVSVTLSEHRVYSEPIRVPPSKEIRANPRYDDTPDERLFEKRVRRSEPLPTPVRPVDQTPPPTREARPRVSFRKLDQPDRAAEDSSEARPVQGANMPPRYPTLARKRGWEGEVTLSITVSEDGSVANVTVESSSGYQTLDDAAVQAVRKWRFSPARKSGKAVASVFKITFEFKLEEKK